MCLIIIGNKRVYERDVFMIKKNIKEGDMCYNFLFLYMCFKLNFKIEYRRRERKGAKCIFFFVSMTSYWFLSSSNRMIMTFICSTLIRVCVCGYYIMISMTRSIFFFLYWKWMNEWMTTYVRCVCEWWWPNIFSIDALL